MKNGSIYITDNLIRFGQSVINADNQNTVKEQEINISPVEKNALPLSIKSFLKENKITPDHLILGIPRSQVSIRYLTFPALKDEEVRQMVELELNNLFPYKPEELIIDYTITQKSAEGYSRVMLVAAQRDIILDKMSILKLAGLAPDEIDISTVSLFNQFYGQKRQPGNYLLINLDDAFAEMILLSEQQLKFSRAVSFNLAAGTGGLVKAVELTATVLRDKGNLIDKIILSGPGPDLKDFAKELEKSLPYTVEIDNTLGVMERLTTRGGTNALNINLLPEEFKIQKQKHKRQKSLIYFGALLLLNLSLIANIVFLNVKARKEYLYLLRSEIKKVNPRASELQKKLINLQILQGYLNSSRQTLGLLSEVYRSAPGGVYISALDISGKKNQRTMVISGQAKDSDMVLKFANGLKGSALIKKADVNYIKKSKSPSQEQAVDFEIRAYF